MKTTKNYREFLFLCLLLLVSLLYNYHSILLKGPWMPHMWRQADCLSLTMNYFKDGLNFFTPAVHWTGPKGNGKTISEFPVIYFTVAKLWTVFGKHYFIYRAIDVLLVFGGLFSLYKISFRILNDSFWAGYVPLFLFTSPVLVYYSNNFLPNAPALGLALTGTYCYFRFIDTEKKRWIFFATLTFILAGLLKITSLIILVSFMGFQLLVSINRLVKKQDSVRAILFRFLPYTVIGIVIFSWIRYTDYYNSKNFRIFLQDLFPIWELSSQQINEIWKSLYFTLLPSFFNKKALAVLAVMFLLNVFFLIRKGSKYIAVVIIAFFGVILYVLLWYKAFDVHDYYLINLLIIIPAICLAFLFEIKSRLPGLFHSKLFRLTAVAALLILMYQTTMINRLKYNARDPLLKYDIVLDKKEKELYAYKQWKYDNTLKAMENVTSYLRSLGIERNDLVISIPDVSINISLFLMDQKGFTDYGYVETKGKPTERIEQFKQIGAKYLIVNDNKAIENQEFLPYLQQKIGAYKNITVYKL